jgi:hypothetical protein
LFFQKSGLRVPARLESAQAKIDGRKPPSLALPALRKDALHREGDDKAPDEAQYAQALKATATPVEGKTCHEVRPLSATPLRHVHFLEPTLFVFSRDPKAIACEEAASVGHAFQRALIKGTLESVPHLWSPAERGFETHFACTYADEATAAQAEAKANELIKQIRKAYETDRQTTVVELREAAIHMFNQVSCARAGVVVTLSWPFDAEFVRHYWAPR